MVSVGDKFPSFNMLGVNDTNAIVDVDILLNEWTVMYFYPKDFTFICPTEIKDMDYLNTTLMLSVSVQITNSVNLRGKNRMMILNTFDTFFVQTQVLNLDAN